MKRLLPVALAIYACGAFAQSAADVSSGTAFADSIAPTSNSQIVNPSAVSSTAWSSGTGISSSTPSGLGGFSTPNTSSSYLTQAQASSLTALGDQAQIDCANYTAGSDAYQNQYCAAVNFLNNQCMEATTGEKSVLGTTGTTQGSTTDCSGTYGAGAAQYSYSDEITSSDSMFSSTSSLATSATDTLTQTCTPETVVTQPAQYEYDTCVVSQDEEDNTCSQYLSATVTKTQVVANENESCSEGTLVNNECVLTTTSTPTSQCPDGYTLIATTVNAEAGETGASCQATNTTAATGTCTAGSASSGYCTVIFASASSCAGTYDGMTLKTCEVRTTQSGHVKYQYAYGIYYAEESCPTGYTYDGTECTETVTTGVTYSCATGSLNGNSCVTTTTTDPTITYSCPAGATLSDTSCITTTTTTSWSDTCGIYEQSAGVSLATPTE